MQWWSADATWFWKRATLSLAALGITGNTCHTFIHPPRWYAADWLILLPFAYCLSLSITAEVRVSLSTRLSYAFMQSIILLQIYVWSDLGRGEEYELIGAVFMIALYTIIMGLVTHTLAHMKMSSGEPSGPAQTDSRSLTDP